MAQPNPIFVTPSTTVVEVLQYQTPYTPVLLNSYSYQGQVVSILDGNSSIGVLFSSIVVSTTNGNTFPSGAISTLINQPQGYITLQSQSPNLWTTLNSFPFRNQYLSAGLYNLTTSTFTTAILSSIQTFTDSVAVEKLVVSGNFIQSSPIILNQTISSFGTVDLYSTVSVYESTFFSSGLLTLGPVQLFSTAIVEGNFTSYSSLQFLSTVFISGSVFVLNNVSAGLISLSSGLVTRSLEVVGSSLSTVALAGSLEVLGELIAKSEIRGGGDLSVSTFVLDTLSTLSSLAIAGTLQVSSLAQFYDRISTQAGFQIDTLLRVEQGTIDINNAFLVGSTLSTTGFTQVNGFMSTNESRVSSLVVLGDFQANSNDVSFAQTLVVGERLLTRDFTSQNITRIGEYLSTTASASLYNSLVANNLSTLGNVSTLVTTVQEKVFTSTLTTLGNVDFNSIELNATGDVVVLGSTILTQTTGIANTVYGGMDVREDLYVTGTLQISSINLPEGLVADNFFVSSLNVGGKAVFATTFIESVQASSIGTGGIVFPSYPLDMANALETQNLSTTSLSTLSFQARLFPTESNVNQSFFHISSSLAVAHPNVENRFDIGPLAVTSCNMRVGETISTSRIIGTEILGTFQGDGSQLSNTNYPFDVVIKDIRLESTLFTQKVTTSTLFASTIVTTGFIPTSTFQVNELSFFGNTGISLFVSTGVVSPSISSPYIAGIKGDGSTYGFPFPEGSFFDARNQVRLNTMLTLGDNLGTNTTENPRGVIINYDKIKGLANTQLGGGTLAWTLAVGGTLRVDNLLGNPVQFDEFRGDDLFVQGGSNSLFTISQGNLLSFANYGTTYVSSGNIRLSSLQFLYDTVSTTEFIVDNTIQTKFSTLIFNSTLYVDRLRSAVGINTQPTYTFDVKDSAFLNSIALGTSSIVENQIRFIDDQQKYLLAVVGDFPQMKWSSDEGGTWIAINLEYPYPIFNVMTDGGAMTVVNQYGYFESVQKQFWIALTSNTILVTTGDPKDGTSWQEAFVDNRTFARNLRFLDADYNGVSWVAVATYSYSGFGENAPTGTIFHTDGSALTWVNITTGGFNGRSDFTNPIETGGRSVAWNGGLWVAVGQGSNSYSGSNSGNNITTNNSILYSADGSNWTNASSGFGFTENVYNTAYSGGFGVVWTGKNWVAVGFTSLSTGMLFSSDGITWREVTGLGFSNLYSPGWGTAIAWNGSRLVASGNGAYTMLYSDTHGESWQLCSGFLPGEASNIVWDGSYWFASGGYGVIKSSDGITWETTSLAGYGTYSIAYSSNATPVLEVGTDETLETIEITGPVVPPLTVAVGVESSYGSGNTMYYSSDGSNWTEVTGPKLTGTGNAVANGGGLWVAGGGDSNYYYTSNLYTSSDGQNWSPVNLDSIYYYYGSPTVQSVTYQNNIWLVGTEFSYANYQSILYSSNGTNWNSATPTYFGLAAHELGTYGFAYGYNEFDFRNGYLAVGKQYYYYSALLYSSDAINWYYGNTTGFFNNYVNEVLGILYANSTWYAVGLPDGVTPTTSILYSGNGVNWSNVSFASADFSAANDIAYNGTKFVAVGTTGGYGNTIKYSGDGINWSDATGDGLTEMKSVAYNSNLSLWIATGKSDTFLSDDVIKYSGDGETWSNNNGTLFQNGNSVASGASSTPPVIAKRQFYNRLDFHRNPLPGVTTRLGTPYIAYTSTILDLNNACKLTTSSNGITLTTTIDAGTSTFTSLQTTSISQTLSTTRLRLEGLFVLNTQYI